MPKLPKEQVRNVGQTLRAQLQAGVSRRQTHLDQPRCQASVGGPIWQDRKGRATSTASSTAPPPGDPQSPAGPTPLGGASEEVVWAGAPGALSPGRLPRPRWIHGCCRSLLLPGKLGCPHLPTPLPPDSRSQVTFPPIPSLARTAQISPVTSLCLNSVHLCEGFLCAGQWTQCLGPQGTRVVWDDEEQ